MALTRSIALNVSGGGVTVNKTVTITDSAAVQIQEAVADSSTDLEIACSIDQSVLSFLYLVSDQAVTIETNSGSTPDDTITLSADVPVIWYTGCGYTNPFSNADVTSLFVTNASGSTANITLEALQDSTP